MLLVCLEKEILKSAQKRRNTLNEIGNNCSFKGCKQLVQHKKQQRTKELLDSFHLNGHT